MKTPEFEERDQQDAELLRQMEIQALERMVAELPAEERGQLLLVVGDKSFTPEQMVEEAKKGSKYGELFIGMQVRARVEAMRRKL